MKAPAYITKTKKFIDKSIDGMTTDFRDVDTYLDTGSYLLNMLISNDFKRGLPFNGKFNVIAGESGSGKSYIASANVVKSAQEQGIYVVIIDTEGALSSDWLTNLGVNIDPAYLTRVSGSTIDDCTKLLTEVIENYKAENGSKPYEERAKLLIILDSLGMLVSPNAEVQFSEGRNVGDLGIKAKMVTTMIRVLLSKILDQPIGFVATTHLYRSNSKYEPDPIAGGMMLEYASSVVVQMNKLLLKEDEDGVKLANGEVSGVRASLIVRKSRFAKPFERCEIRIPYHEKMDRMSGVGDFFIKKGVLVKSGHQYTYTSPVTGEVITKFRKHFKSSGLLMQIIDEWEHWDKLDTVKVGIGVDSDDVEDVAE